METGASESELSELKATNRQLRETLEALRLELEGSVEQAREGLEQERARGERECALLGQTLDALRAELEASRQSHAIELREALELQRREHLRHGGRKVAKGAKLGLRELQHLCLGLAGLG